MQTTGKFLEMRPLACLRAAPNNARTHSVEQIAQLAAAIREFGFTSPILISPDGEIRAGHGRLEAARTLGMTEVPTLVVGADWSPEQVRAYIIADNKLALAAGWDFDILAAELKGLHALDFDLALTGFCSEEIAGLLANEGGGLKDPDEAPELPERPVTQPGDVWILGKHRLACGDSTNRATVAGGLGGAKPHLMVTDPPYGVAYEPAWRKRSGLNAGGAFGVVANDDRADWREAWALFPGDVAYVWHAGVKARAAVESLESCGFQMRAQIVWAKQQFAIGRGDYHHQHEPCWYAVRKGKAGRYVGGRKQSTLWQIDKPQKSETGHSTQKPVECMKRPIDNNSKPGDVVYDPFLGSGTTLIAGEMTARSVRAIELLPAYVDVAVRRWEEFTGRFAVLESSSATFMETMKLRTPRE